MNIANVFTKTLSAVGSIGGLAADAIEGTIDVGSKAKKALDNEVNSLQSERDIENATARILARRNAISKISDSLHITPEQAEELLEQELRR